MSKDFIKPDFSKGEVELRFENNVICIYGTADGLKYIAKLCQELTDNPNKGHVHLEDYELLTKKSEKGAIAIFKK